PVSLRPPRRAMPHRPPLNPPCPLPPRACPLLLGSVCTQPRSLPPLPSLLRDAPVFSSTAVVASDGRTSPLPLLRPNGSPASPSCSSPSLQDARRPPPSPPRVLAPSRRLRLRLRRRELHHPLSSHGKPPR